MTDLAVVTCALGGAKLTGSLCSLYAPDSARKFWLGFARNEVAGWVLTALTLGWSCWLLLNTPPFSGMPRIEPLVYVGGPLAFFILVIFLDEMLAARALGGALLLLGNPFLTAARENDSGWSVIITLLAYAWIVFGMVLVVSPFRFRQLAEHVTQDRRRFRLSNLAGLLVGAGLLLLGTIVY